MQSQANTPREPNLALTVWSQLLLTGFCASAVSDSCSNSIRVLKVYKQTKAEPVSYPQAFREVVAKDGILGLMGRGLGTKIASNGVQGMLFAVLWKLIDDKFKKLFN